MSCYSCSDVEIQVDDNLGIRHTDRCNHYSGNAEICGPGMVSDYAILYKLVVSIIVGLVIVSPRIQVL